MTFEMYLREMKMDARAEERFQMVKNLILASTPIECIMKATGWSEEKILQFEKDLNKSEKSFKENQQHESFI